MKNLFNKYTRNEIIRFGVSPYYPINDSSFTESQWPTQEFPRLVRGIRVCDERCIGYKKRFNKVLER